LGDLLACSSAQHDSFDEKPCGLDHFHDPLYTVTEAARYLGMPKSTLETWPHGYRRRPQRHHEAVGAPVLTALPKIGHRGPVIPFIGVAEGLVLTAMRHSGVPLQRIRPALARLGKQFGLTHALASKRLYTDGAEVMFDYAETGEDPGAARAARELVVVRNGQRVFNEVIEAYLRRLAFGEDGYARLIQLPAYRVAEVVVDPSRGFGQPIFAHGGVRLEDAIGIFRAGEPLDVVAEEYGLPRDHLEDASPALPRTGDAQPPESPRTRGLHVPSRGTSGRRRHGDELTARAVRQTTPDGERIDG
jgi:uncharacterized protein (DUF433 family)